MDLYVQVFPQAWDDLKYSFFKWIPCLLLPLLSWNPIIQIFVFLIEYDSFYRPSSFF